MTVTEPAIRFGSCIGRHAGGPTASGIYAAILLVDMSRVVVGQRDAVNVLYDPYSLSASDQVVIRSTTRWGIALLDEEAVQIVAGVKAS
jgi:HK97 family phage major capsid protein